MRAKYTTRTESSFWDQLSFFGRQLCLCVICFSASETSAQFTVERSPWLDSGAVTDESIEQTWTVQDGENNRALDVEVIVEGLNPRKAVSLTIPEEKVLSLQPQRRYTRICVEPNYMIYSDRIYADPAVLRDTMELLPLAVGMEVELEPIVFYPGTNDLYFSSIPTLEALLTFLKVNPTLTLSIQSNRGYSGSAKNLGMAKRQRARAVSQYLLSSGIATQRLAIESSPKRATPNREPETIEEAEAAQRIIVRVTNY